MAFTKLTKSQNAFLESHLRGTNRVMSADQARATYGIQNLRARMSDLRTEGLVVRTGRNTNGKTVYAISRRDIFGCQSKIWR